MVCDIFLPQGSLYQMRGAFSQCVHMCFCETKVSHEILFNPSSGYFPYLLMLPQ